MFENWLHSRALFFQMFAPFIFIGTTAKRPLSICKASVRVLQLLIPKFQIVPAHSCTGIKNKRWMIIFFTLFIISIKTNFISLIV
jgi:hypothetical protein